MKPIAAPLAAALLVFASACDPGFDPQSLITKPRILGIRADPPEVQFTEAEQGATTLTAFLALPEVPKDGPPGPRELASLDWTLCLLNLGSQAAYRCALPEQPMDSDPAARTATLDGASLYAQIDLLQPLFPQFIEYVKQTVAQDDDCQMAVIAAWDACQAANPDDPAPCVGPGFQAERRCLLDAGQDATVHLRATWTDGTDTVVADAYKKIRFRPVTAERPANRNPAFSVVLQRATLPEPTWISSTSAPSPSPIVVACPGQKVTFEPVLDEGARESYVGTDGVRADEFVLFSWFATAGEFDRIKSSTATARPGDPIDLSNDFRMPDSGDFPSSFPVWVVARDDRLGFDLVQFQVRRRDDASCTRPAGAAKDWKPPEPEVILDAPGYVLAPRAAARGGAA